jgi:hypothetical protein
MEPYTFEKLNEDNLSDVSILVKARINKNHPVSYFQKKFKTPWSGGKFYGWLAYETTSRKPVAFVGALPLLASFAKGDFVHLANLVDAVTLQEHAGRRLMSQLVEKTVASLVQDGISLVYVFPNQYSVQPLLNDLGFANPWHMEYYEVAVAALPLEALCRRCGVPGIFRWWAGRILTPYLSPKDHYPENSVLAEGFGGILHNKVYYDYKSFSFNRLCCFSEINSWLKLENGLLVGDVLLPENCNDVQFDGWLLQLKKIARLAGLRKILFNTYPGSRVSIKLSARYPSNASWPLCYRTQDPDMAVLLEKLRFCYGDFDTF